MPIFYFFLAFAGLVLFLQGPTLQPLMAEFQVSESIGGLLPLGYFFGSTLGTAIFPALAARRGTRQTLWLMIAVAEAGFGLILLAPGVGLAIGGFALVGAACGLFCALPSALLAQLHGAAAARPINRYYSVFAISAPLAPPLAGYLIDAGYGWRGIYLLPALAFAALAPFLARLKLPDLRRGESGGGRVIWETVGLAPRFLLGLMLVLFCYIGAESSVNFWSVKYLLETFPGVSAGRASLVVSGFWLGMFGGRLCSAVALKRISALWLMVLLALGAILCVAGGAAAPGFWPALLLLSASGLFFSGLWPTAVSFAERFPPRLAGAGLSLVMIGGGFGGMSIPYLIGLTAARAGYRSGMFTIILFPALIIILLLALRPDRVNLRRIA